MRTIVLTIGKNSYRISKYVVEIMQPSLDKNEQKLNIRRSFVILFLYLFMYLFTLFKVGTILVVTNRNQPTS